MQRDLNLIREILLKKESEEDFSSIEGYEEYLINEHIYLLNEAGFIEADIQPDASGYIRLALINRITWEGYEFLNTIRDKSIFNKAMEKIKPIGSFMIPLVRSLCIELIKEQLK